MITAELLRDEALEQVAQGESSAWVDTLRDMVVLVAREKEEFTSDDVWRWLAELPSEPRILGSVMSALAKEGLIEKTGTYRKSKRPECHARPLAVWRGRGVL
jgi:hypothetical protein